MRRTADSQFDLAENIRELFGDEILVAVSRAFGGTNVYIPARYNPENAFCVIFGEERFAKIADRFADLRLYVSASASRLATEATIQEMRAAGRTVTEVARLTGFSERRIYRLAAARRRANQLARDAAQSEEKA